MKVLMVFTSVFNYSGITSVVMNYYRELIKYKNMTIDFVIPNNPPEDLYNELKVNRSNVYIIPMEKRRKKTFKYINELTELMIKGKYDIMHVHGSSSIMFLELYCAKKANIDIRIAHSHNTKTQHPFLNKLFNPLFKKYYTDAFACGKEAGKWLFKNNNFYIVYNAQKIDKYEYSKNFREEYRKKYNLEDKIVLGHVGGFTYQKNHEFLIRTLDKLIKKDDKYRLVLIGGGRLENEIRKQIDDLKLNDYVIFTGRTTKVNEWLNALDIMLLPSRYEGLPNVLVEWQINGLPCIVSDVVTEESKITDLVSFEKLDENLWVKKILETKKSNRETEKNIIQIQESGYDIEKNAKELYKKYKSLCKKEDNYAKD